MKITIPENITEITLAQYQEYYKLLERTDLSEHDVNFRKIKIFAGLNQSQVQMISSKDYAEIVSLIDLALAKEAEFKPTFFIGDVEFGFVPNLDEITSKEYIDITKYEGKIEELHRLMAILFRPIKKRDILNNYSIVDYQGTENYANVMKQTPLSCVNGAMVFFSSLGNELANYTSRFSKMVQAREKSQMTTSQSGVGMQQ